LQIILLTVYEKILTILSGFAENLFVYWVSPFGRNKVVLREEGEGKGRIQFSGTSPGTDWENRGKSTSFRIY